MKRSTVRQFQIGFFGVLSMLAFQNCSSVNAPTTTSATLNSTTPLPATPTPMPTVAPVVLSLANVQQVSSGEYETCAVLATGQIACLGYNGSGQLGNTTTLNSGVGVQVYGITNAVNVQVGAEFACALLATGAVDCWGTNNSGQLGNGTFDSSPVPVPVIGITNAKQIVTGTLHACALLTNGEVQCWGNNQSLQFGMSTPTQSNTPVTVTTIPTTVAGLAVTVTSLAAGALETCALMSTGAVVCWGQSNVGQVGEGTPTPTPTPITPTPTPATPTPTPTPLPPPADIAPSVVFGIDGVASAALSVAVGTTHACVVMQGGTVKCWGAGGSDELGLDPTIPPLSTNNPKGDSLIPLSVPTISTAVSVSLGDAYSCALLSTGGVNCWGTAKFGTLGNGSGTTTFNPQVVTGITSATAITAGGTTACALLAAGTLECWGDNSFEQLEITNPSKTQSDSPVLLH